MEAAIALGGNLGDSRRALDQALDRIAVRIGPILAASGWIETPALVHPDDPVREHPSYLNGVVVAATELPAEEILARLLEIERALGRVRDPEALPWQPRVIDLDLILLGEEVVDLPGLTLPHPRMHERDFVLGPLARVRPDWRHPVLGQTVASLLTRLSAGDGADDNMTGS
ncbi:2-amino-4-hydroxy-6-hydroxymethyldihydropteridine diphosphokinase [Geminicoccus flavidas]|uniref:2-amino-4-hydroxy-6- hydroxymethyldihydropteridine diphosphokinase n=1 Tax=Geminicoccus flavidas TaxID=2506407 RepID=UPI00190FA3C6|nr:2-amino-4-hydroxy-6-hydroxymethyldihydropteridine diphosphokinase [Geminicoccus flavidas]